MYNTAKEEDILVLLTLVTRSFSERVSCCLLQLYIRGRVGRFSSGVAGRGRGAATPFSFPGYAIAHRARHHLYLFGLLCGSVLTLLWSSFLLTFEGNTYCSRCTLYAYTP